MCQCRGNKPSWQQRQSTQVILSVATDVCLRTTIQLAKRLRCGLRHQCPVIDPSRLSAPGLLHLWATAAWRAIDSGRTERAVASERLTKEVVDKDQVLAVCFLVALAILDLLPAL